MQKTDLAELRRLTQANGDIRKERDRRQKLIGAAEELGRIAANWYEEMVAWTATDFEQRAAQLRREAEGK